MSEHTNLKNILEMCFANNGEFQWSFIDAYFEDNDESLSDVEKFSIFCDKVIDNFNSFDFSDVVLVARIIDMIIISIDPDIPRENDTFKESVLNVMSRTLEQRQESELFHICSDLDFAYVAKTMFTGRVDLMKILVRYGVCNSSSTREEGNETPIASGNRRASRSDFFTQKRLSTASASMYHRQKQARRFLSVAVPSSLLDKRGYLVLTGFKLAVERSLLKMPRLRPRIDDLACYRLHFQAVPDPIVTLAEVEKIWLQITDKDNRDIDMKELGKRMKVHLPECTRPFQPRSLLHLSRCHVRDSVRKVGVLPRLVTDLITNQLIPRTLEAVLLSDETQLF